MQRGRAFVALIRPRDWVKNALVLAPLLFGAKLFERDAVGRAALAALAYCLAASAGTRVRNRTAASIPSAGCRSSDGKLPR